MSFLIHAWSYAVAVLTIWWGIFGILSGAWFVAELVGAFWPKLGAAIQARRKSFAVVCGLMLVVAQFGVWQQQGTALRNSLGDARDSARMWRMRSDSCAATKERLKVAGAAAKTLVEAERREGIIRKLGTLINEGNAVKETALNGPYRPVDDTALWKAKVRAYLKRSLGEGYVVRFDQARPSEGFFDGVHAALMALWNDVDGKQTCLTEFIKELQSEAR